MPISQKTLQAFLILVFLIAIGIYIYFRDTNAERREHSADELDLTTDLTALAKDNKLPLIVGMDEVVERLIHVIARKQKNNPLMIGEPGVGKTAAIEGLAKRIIEGNVPPSFKNKKILRLNLNVLLAGTKYRGELERRLQALLHSLENENRDTILFIDEIHMIQQARGSEGSLDIADILKPALSRGEIQLVGATTWKEYEHYIKPDGALDRRLQPVLVEEPSRESAIQILQGAKKSYEDYHGVCIPHRSIEKAVDTSIKIIKDRFLPDKAFDIIDEACAKVAIEAGQKSHGAALGLLHDASRYAAECGGSVPVVTEADIETIAKQWKGHHRVPHAKS